MVYILITQDYFPIFQNILCDENYKYKQKYIIGYLPVIEKNVLKKDQSVFMSKKKTENFSLKSKLDEKIKIVRNMSKRNTGKDIFLKYSDISPKSTYYTSKYIRQKQQYSR